jgi:hypothetical protein
MAGVPIMTALLVMGLGSSRRYEVTWHDQRIGAAELGVTRNKKSVRFTWKATLGVASANCLEIEESEAGEWNNESGTPLPEPLFLVVPSSSECRTVVSSGGEVGQGCLTRHNSEVAGQLFGQPVQARLGVDGLPDEVDLPSISIVYRKSTGGGDAPCADPLSAAQRLIGGEKVRDARRILRSEFRAGGHTYLSRRGSGEIPGPLADVMAKAFEKSTGRDCKEVARDLERSVKRLGIEVRSVAGLLWDHGELWPHAWNEINLPESGWTAFDATTGSSFADAGRLKVGSLEQGQALTTGLALLAISTQTVEVLSYEP